ncbi:MAG: molybdenum cofactor guanylyltransferase [Candidatus Omnitrophica bacterium]|nr:molybdenum cofactor guanylyltransferase [Candidatus Omnitrophota bacterium]MBI3008933.1 molybdenum cofactor guanylyltransferase [Candidatus Omnitrophota bacterium]
MKLTGIILAGGKNTRIGTNKALLKIGEKTIIENIISRISPLFPEILLITNYPDEFRFLKGSSIHLFPDVITGANSMGGIYSGLSNSKTRYNFLFACDMPFINPELVSYMIKETQGNDIVIPEGKTGSEPLHAIYSKNCIEPFKELITKGDLKITNIFNYVKVKVIKQAEISCFDPEGIAFFNVNTMADYNKIKEGKRCRIR